MCINTKTHVCGICVKLKSLLKTHYRQVKCAQPKDTIHFDDITVGPRPKYNCLICMKQFRFKSSLQAHLRTHQGVSGLKTEIKQEIPDLDYDGETDEHEPLENDSEHDYTENAANEHSNNGITKKEEGGFEAEGQEADKGHSTENLHNIKLETVSDLKLSTGNSECQQCMICLEEFDDTESLQEHTRTVHKGVLKSTENDADEKHTSGGENRCQICRKNYRSQKSLFDHKKKYHRETLYGGKSASSTTVKKKKTGKKKSGEHYCSICDKSYKTRKTLFEHTKKFHKGTELPKDLHCPICLKECSNIDSLKNHARSRHNTPWDEIKHMAVEDGAGGLACPFCEKVFINEWAVGEHSKMIHGVLPIEDSPPTYGCPFCPRRYRELKELKDHLRRKHDRVPYANEELNKLEPKHYKPFMKEPSPTKKKKAYEDTYIEGKCPICLEEIASLGALKDHIRANHDMSWADVKDMSAGDGDEKHPCNFCDNTFANEWALGEHTKVVHKIKPKHSKFPSYQCPLCPRRYKSMKAIRDHCRGNHKVKWTTIDESVRENVKNTVVFPKEGLPKPDKSQPPPQPYKCTVCGKAFRFKHYLKLHASVHTGEKPHSCEYCGQRFRAATTLKLHIRTHTGEKPYECKVCHRRFGQPTSLKHHMLTHTREYNYSCHLCGKRYMRANHLSFHLRMHSDVRNYKCDQCGKGFVSPYCLKKHQRVHTQERPYMCDVCGMTFRWSKNVSQHKKSQHPAQYQEEQLARKANKPPPLRLSADPNPQLPPPIANIPTTSNEQQPEMSSAPSSSFKREIEDLSHHNRGGSGGGQGGGAPMADFRLGNSGQGEQGVPHNFARNDLGGAEEQQRPLEMVIPPGGGNNNNPNYEAMGGAGPAGNPHSNPAAAAMYPGFLPFSSPYMNPFLNPQDFR